MFFIYIFFYTYIFNILILQNLWVSWDTFGWIYETKKPKTSFPLIFDPGKIFGKNYNNKYFNTGMIALKMFIIKKNSDTK